MIKRFLLAWRIMQGFPYDERYEDDNTPWEPEDANWLLTLLHSPTGVKFRKRLQNQVALTNSWAIQQRTDAVGSAGFARGVTHLISFIERHLPQELPHAAAHSSTSDSTDEQGQSVALEQLVP